MKKDDKRRDNRSDKSDKEPVCDQKNAAPEPATPAIPAPEAPKPVQA